MTAVQAGALRDDADKWSSIDFEHARREVRRLQVRIAKAVQENRWNKVRALQYLLTHSFHAKLLAVKRVTSNKGKKTPGIDGVLWRGARAKWRAACSLRRRGYHPQPLRRIYIEKKNGKLRPLSIPIMYDRAQQALYKLALAPVAETTADRTPMVFGKADPVPMPWPAPLMRCQSPIRHHGFWRGTSRAVSTISLSNGYWRISPWTKPFFRNG